MRVLWHALGAVSLVAMVGSSAMMFVVSDDPERWLFLPGIVIAVLLVTRDLYLRYERRANRVVLPGGAAEDSRGFFLVLRAFDQVFYTRRTAQRREPIDVGGGVVRQLVRALEPHGTVLLVGGVKIKGAVMLRPPQHVWKRLVIAAAEDARAVILIPSLSLGVREEIFDICQGPVKHKLIVYIPPDTAPDIATDSWKPIQATYARLGIHFPADYAGGFVYRPLDGTLRTLENGDRRARDRPDSLNAELLSLVDRIPGPGTPFQSSLHRLLGVMREPVVSDAPEAPFLPPLHAEVLRVACRLAECNEDGSFASADLKEAVMPEDDEEAFWGIVEEFVRHGFMTVSLFRSTLTMKAAGLSRGQRPTDYLPAPPGTADR